MEKGGAAELADGSLEGLKWSSRPEQLILQQSPYAPKVWSVVLAYPLDCRVRRLGLYMRNPALEGHGGKSRREGFLPLSLLKNSVLLLNPRGSPGGNV